MRKYQVEKAFQVFCDDYLILSKPATVYGGVKDPKAHFEVSGIQFTFQARDNRAIKCQARDTLVFHSAKELLHYVKQQENMKSLDPLYRGVSYGS